MQLLRGVDISNEEDRGIIEYNHKDTVYNLTKEHPLAYTYMLPLTDWHKSNKRNKCIYLTKQNCETV